MRNFVSTGLAIVAFALAMPTMAQNQSAVNQDGENSNVDVVQSGSGNDSTVTQEVGSEFGDVEVTQSGTNAISSVTQTGVGTDAVDPNTVEVIQDGDGAESIVTQGNGDRLAVYVDQVGASFSMVSQDTTNSRTEIYQTGDFNESVVFQSASSSSVGDTDDLAEGGVIQSGTNNRSGIIQTGNRKRATVTQIGDDNQSDVSQSLAGRPVFVDITQIGNTNLSDVIQDVGPPGGQTALVTINQISDDNVSMVTQTGSDSSVTITQLGPDGLNNSSVIQSATASVILVDQEGFDISGAIARANSSAITQSGTDNMIDSEQVGDDNISTILQGGSGNAIMLVSGGVGNISDITQTGIGNVIDVLQDGDANESIILQSGDGNTANVTQETDGNFSTITQTGNGNTVTVNQ